MPLAVEPSQHAWEYREETIAGYMPFAHSIANRIQWNPADHDDLVQEGLIALLKSMREYKQPGKPAVTKPLALACMVMEREMKWWYKPKDRETTTEEIQEYHLVEETEDEIFAAAYFREYFDEIERLFGRKTREIAEQLVDPHGLVIDIAMTDMTARAGEAQGGTLKRGYKTLIVKHEHIRKAYQLGENEWYRTLNHLRHFTHRFVTTLN
jgi:RNA polymerase sigma factor (sigma-70 family)